MCLRPTVVGTKTCGADQRTFGSFIRSISNRYSYPPLLPSLRLISTEPLLVYLPSCSSTSSQRPRRGSCFAQVLKQMVPFAHRLPHSTLLIGYNNDEDMPLQLVRNESIERRRPQLTMFQRREILSSSVVVLPDTSPPSRPVKLVSRYNELIALQLDCRIISDLSSSTGCLHRKAWLSWRHMFERRLHSFKVPP